jgi:hypothetical protein
VVDVPQKFDGYAVTVYATFCLMMLVLHLSFGHLYVVQKGMKKLNNMNTEHPTSVVNICVYRKFGI